MTACLESELGEGVVGVRVGRYTDRIGFQFLEGPSIIICFGGSIRKFCQQLGPGLRFAGADGGNLELGNGRVGEGMGPAHIAGTDHEYTDLLGITHFRRVKGLGSAGNPIRWLVFFDQIVLNLGNMPVVLLILKVPGRCFVQDDRYPLVQLQGRTWTNR